MCPLQEHTRQPVTCSMKAANQIHFEYNFFLEAKGGFFEECKDIQDRG